MDSISILGKEIPVNSNAKVWTDETGILSGAITGTNGDDVYEANFINSLELVDNSGDNFVLVNNNAGEYGYVYAIKDSKLQFIGDGYTGIVANKINSGYYGFHISKEIEIGDGGSDIEVGLKGRFVYQNNILNGVKITTGAGSDNVGINLLSEGGTMDWFFGMYGGSVSLGEGNDSFSMDFQTKNLDANGNQITYQPRGDGNPYTIAVALGSVDLGGGNDRIEFKSLGKGIESAYLLGGDGDDEIEISSRLGAMISSTIDSGEGNDKIIIESTKANEYAINNSTITSGSGDDYIELNSSRDSTVDMGDGVDTLKILGRRSEYNIDSVSPEKVNISKQSDAFFSLVAKGVEKIQFLDDSNTSPTYFITQSPTPNVAEGATFTTSVQTTELAVGTEVFWSAGGTNIDDDDFTGGAQELEGQATVDADGKFSFTHSIKNDNKTEGNETLQVKLYSDSARTTQVGSTASSTITDSSTTPPTYSVTHSPSGTVEEGETLTTTLQTTGVDEGATIYWTADGENIDEDDFSSGEVSGEGTVDADGKVTISHNLANDEISEGDETLQFAFYSDEDHSTAVTRSSTVTVSDTSKTPPTYTISSSSPAINEGGTLNTTVRTTDLPAGTKIYWSAGGTGIDDNDFSQGELSGEGIVGEDGTFTFSHKLAYDNKTEGNETLQVKLFSSSDYTVQLGETESTKIFDTSRNSVIVTKQEGDAHAGINEDLPRGQSNVVGIRTRNLNVNGNGEFDSDVDSTSTAVATTGNGNASAHVRQSLLGISISDSSRIGGDGKFTSILTHDSDNSASAVNGTADVQDRINSISIDASNLNVHGKSNFGSYMSVRSQNSADTTQTNDENISTNASASLNRNQLPGEPNIVGMRFDRLTLDNKGVFNSQVDNTSDMSANSIRGDASTFSNNSVIGIGFNGASRITGDAQVTSLLTQRSFSDSQSVHGTAITEDHHSVIGVEAHDLTVAGNASFSSTVVVRALSNSGT